MDTERWDLYDRDGKPLGRTIVRGRRLSAGEHHLVVHIWVVNSVGRYLLQRRSPRRRLMPNMWAATGGSAITGEDSLTAARRELAEELGIRPRPEEFQFLGRLNRRNSLCDLWLVQKDVPVTAMRLQKEEVAQVRWVTREQLEEMVNDGRFHHYGAPYFRFLFREIEKRVKKNDQVAD